MKTAEKQDKRQNILAVAEKLFSEQGFEGTSTRQIAKEAGANMAMINYYFGGKEGVFTEILSKRIEHFNPLLRSISEEQAPTLEKLFHMVEGYVRRIMSNMAFHRMMQREVSLIQRPEIYNRIKEAMIANLTVLEDMIDKGIDSGEFRQVDVKMLIATMLGTVTNVVMFPFRITNGTDLDINVPKDAELIANRLVAHLKEIMTTYLTPQK